MQSSNIPSGIQLPFANAGAKQTIPVASQIGVVNGRASYTDGFPPLTRTPVIAGGVPPFGTDFNGILNAITAIQQWQTAGGLFKFDATWSTANSGYPKGAVIANASNDGAWLSLVENNTTNPDTAVIGTGDTNWMPITSGPVATVSTTGGSVNLTAAQWSRDLIIITGTLASNGQISFPKLTGKRWYVIDATVHGAFSLSIVTAGGTPVLLYNGGIAMIRGDGTNVLNDAVAVGAASQPPHATRFDQVFGVGQTLQNVTASRAIGNTYTNGTGKPILWTATVAVAAGQALGMQLNSGGVYTFGNNSNATTNISGTLLVLPGYSYGITGSGGTLTSWFEIR